MFVCVCFERHPRFRRSRVLFPLNSSLPLPCLPCIVTGSLIKKLQRELREARRGGPGREATERMRALEEKAATAEHANRKAKEDVRRMKRLILVGGGVADVVVGGGGGKCGGAPSARSDLMEVFQFLIVADDCGDEPICESAALSALSSFTAIDKHYTYTLLIEDDDECE